MLTNASLAVSRKLCPCLCRSGLPDLGCLSLLDLPGLRLSLCLPVLPCLS